MYQLIVDSGSTKADWIVLHRSQILFKEQTIGFNPYFHTKDEICKEINVQLKIQLLPYLPMVEVIHYYGTACSTEENCLIIKSALFESLGVEKIIVEHDLLAAARALCQREWGIAGILGTGSNSCLYNGKDILENVPSAGYLWSDYGGGSSQIGKMFIKEYFEDTMPKDIRQNFEAAGYNKDAILNNVYKKGVPSRYLATVSSFTGKHINHPFVKKVLVECFTSFFEQQVAKYTNSYQYKVHTVGSIGFYYKDLIAEVALKQGYQMGTVIKSPMEGLINFHGV